jgi:hypothetical protein
VIALLMPALVVTTVAAADTRPPAPVFVTMQSTGRVRVQLAEGLTLPCDSGENRMLFDGTLGPNETAQSAIGGECVCVRHTTDAFPRSGWSAPQLVCRPRICRGKRCWPAPDPTIRLTLDGVSGR